MVAFKSEILIQQNDKTGMRAITFDEDDKEIFIRKGSQTIRMTLRSHVDVMMHQYGSSKIMHWNDKCAKPNTLNTSTRVRMLDGLLKGHNVCKNCWDRTRSFNN
jgi:hypothetical protein